jgi:SSS family solute:Na+ symporter
MLLAVLWTPQITRFPSLWQYLQSILSYITPPVVVVFMLGIFWRQGTATAATVTLAAGIPIGLLGWSLNEIYAIYQIQFLYACGVMTLICIIIFVGISLISERPTFQRILSLTWSLDFWRSESRQLEKLPWYRDYRVQAAGLLAAALIIVAIWW